MKFFPTIPSSPPHISQDKAWKIGLAAVPFVGHPWSFWNVSTLAASIETSHPIQETAAKIQICKKYCFVGVIRNVIVIVGAEAAVLLGCVRKPWMAHALAGGHFFAAVSDWNNLTRYQEIMRRCMTTAGKDYYMRK